MKKKIIFIITVCLFLIGCKTKEKQQIAELKMKVDSLNYEIVELNDRINVMNDELQIREGEISYWGHKYDSCMTILKTKK